MRESFDSMSNVTKSTKCRPAAGASKEVVEVERLMGREKERVIGVVENVVPWILLATGE